MGLGFLFDSACGVPRASFVDDPHGAETVARCARIEGRIWAGMCYTIALVFLILFFVKDSRTNKPLLPLWVSAIPFAFGVCVLYAAPFWAQKEFAVDLASFQKSSMTKKEWLEQQFAYDRARLGANATFNAGLLVANSLAHSSKR